MVDGGLSITPASGALPRDLLMTSSYGDTGTKPLGAAASSQLGRRAARLHILDFLPYAQFPPLVGTNQLGDPS